MLVTSRVYVRAEHTTFSHHLGSICIPHIVGVFKNKHKQQISTHMYLLSKAACLQKGLSFLRQNAFCGTPTRGPFCLSMCLCVRKNLLTYVRTYVRTSIRPPARSSIRPSVPPSVCLSLRPSVCPSTRDWACHIAAGFLMHRSQVTVRRTGRRVAHVPANHFCSPACSYGLFSDGLYCYGLNSSGLCSHGLCSHGLCSYGRQAPIDFSCSPACLEVIRMHINHLCHAASYSDLYALLYL